jgi:hypothetical protein
MWLQAVLYVYCHHITYTDLPSVHLGYHVGYRLKLLTQSYWTVLYRHLLHTFWDGKRPSKSSHTKSHSMTNTNCTSHIHIKIFPIGIQSIDTIPSYTTYYISYVHASVLNLMIWKNISVFYTWGRKTFNHRIQFLQLTKSKKKSYPCNRPSRPIGLWNIKAPTFPKQSAQRWRWGCHHYEQATLYPQKDSWYSFLSEATGRIRSIAKSRDLTGNRTRDLPTCSIVPQRTTLPRATVY